MGAAKPPPVTSAPSVPLGRMEHVVQAAAQPVDPATTAGTPRRVEQGNAGSAAPGTVFVRAFAALQPLSLAELDVLWRHVMTSAGTGDAATVMDRAIAAYENAGAAE